MIAKLITPGSEYEPKGFILTTALGVAGALVATYQGQLLGWYKAGQGAGFIGGIVGAVFILLVWGFIERRRRTLLADTHTHTPEQITLNQSQATTGQ